MSSLHFSPLDIERRGDESDQCVSEGEGYVSEGQGEQPSAILHGLGQPDSPDIRAAQPPNNGNEDKGQSGAAFAVVKSAGAAKGPTLNMSLHSVAAGQSTTANSSVAVDGGEEGEVGGQPKRKFFPTRSKPSKRAGSAEGAVDGDTGPSGAFAMHFPAAVIQGNAAGSSSSALFGGCNGASSRAASSVPATPQSIAIASTATASAGLLHAHHTALPFDRTVTYLDISGLGLTSAELDALCLEVAFPSLITLNASSNRLTRLPCERFFADRRSTSSSQLWHLDFSNNLLDFDAPVVYVTTTVATAGSSASQSATAAATNLGASMSYLGPASSGGGAPPLPSGSAASMRRDMGASMGPLSMATTVEQHVGPHPQLCLSCPALGSLNLSGNAALTAEGTRRVLRGLVVADLYLPEAFVGRGNVATEMAKHYASGRGTGSKSSALFPPDASNGNNPAQPSAQVEALASILEALGGCLAVNGYCLPVPPPLQCRRYEHVQQALRTGAHQWRPQRDLLRCLRRRNAGEAVEPMEEARELLVCVVCANEALRLSAVRVTAEEDARGRGAKPREPWELPPGHSIGREGYAYNIQRSFWHQPPVRWAHWKMMDDHSAAAGGKGQGRFSYVFVHAVAAAAECEYIDQETLAVITARLIDEELTRQQRAHDDARRRRRLRREAEAAASRTPPSPSLSAASHSLSFVRSDADGPSHAALDGGNRRRKGNSFKKRLPRTNSNSSSVSKSGAGGGALGASGVHDISGVLGAGGDSVSESNLGPLLGEEGGASGESAALDSPPARKYSASDEDIIAQLAGDVLSWPMYVLQYIAHRLCAHRGPAALKYPTAARDTDVLVVHRHVQLSLTDEAFAPLVKVSPAFERRVRHYKAHGGGSSSFPSSSSGAAPLAAGRASAEGEGGEGTTTPSGGGGYRARLFARLNGGHSLRDTLHYVSEEAAERHFSNPLGAAASRHRVLLPASSQEPSAAAKVASAAIMPSSTNQSRSPTRRARSEAADADGTFLTTVSGIDDGSPSPSPTRHKRPAPAANDEAPTCEGDQQMNGTCTNGEEELLHHTLNSGDSSPLLGSDMICSRGFAGPEPWQMERLRQRGERSRSIAAESRARRSDLSYKRAVMLQPPLRVPRPSSCLAIQQALQDEQRERSLALGAGGQPSLGGEREGGVGGEALPVYFNSNTVSARDAAAMGLTRTPSASRPATPSAAIASGGGATHASGRLSSGGPNNKTAAAPPIMSSSSGVGNASLQHLSERGRLVASMTLEEFLAHQGIRAVCGDQQLITSALAWGAEGSAEGPEELNVEARLRAIYEGKGATQQSADPQNDGGAAKDGLEATKKDVQQQQEPRLQWPVPNYRLGSAGRASPFLSASTASTSSSSKPIIHDRQQQQLNSYSSSAIQKAVAAQFNQSLATHKALLGTAAAPILSADTREGSAQWGTVSNAIRLADATAPHPFTAGAAEAMGRIRERAELKRRQQQQHGIGSSVGNGGGHSAVVGGPDASAMLLASGGAAAAAAEERAKATACSASLRNIRVEHRGPDTRQFIPIEIRRELERRRRGTSQALQQQQRPQ